MTTSGSISQQLERQSVVAMESSIPADMTIELWRRQRSAQPRAARRRTVAAAARVVALRPVPCDHLHDTTTRYDPDQKQLSFLLVCPVCHTEKLVETQSYEPRFEPHPPANPVQQAGTATVHHLPSRRHPRPTRRAA